MRRDGRRTWSVILALVMALAAPVPADELQDTVDRADALGLLNRIGLQQSQATQMVGPLERIQSIVRQHEQHSEQRLSAMRPTLQRARAALVAGEELPEDIAQTLQAYREQRRQARLSLMRAVNREMTAIADLMYPEQNERLDWRPPASVDPQQHMRERLELQKIAVARIEQAAAMLDRVKHLDAFNFATGRGPIINDYLSLYFEPETQRFQQAYQMALEHTDRVRMLSEEQWQANAMDIAAELVDRLGLMPSIDRGMREGTVSWHTLYEVFKDPQTLQVVKRIANQR